MLREQNIEVQRLVDETDASLFSFLSLIDPPQYEATDLDALIRLSNEFK